MTEEEAAVAGYELGKQAQEEEDEFIQRPGTSIQFSDKIIEPDVALIKKIKEVFPGTDNGLIDNIKLMYRSITRDYSLGNLARPKKNNDFNFVDFCHSQKAIYLFSGRPHLALAMDALMKGTLLLGRSINMKQQELLQTTFLRKSEESISTKRSGGLIPNVKG